MCVMFEKWMEFVGLYIYTVLTGFLLVYFEASILIVVALLLVLPAIIMWRLEFLTAWLLPILLLIAVAVTVLFEATAYINGIWYELSPSEVRVFGLFPVEAFLVAFSQVLYAVVLYEYFLDDREVSGDALVSWLLGGSVVVLGSGLAYVYLFSDAILSYGFGWVLLVGFTVFSLMIGLLHRHRLSILKKAAWFATLLYPIMLVLEYVSLENSLRFFANTNEYLFSFTIAGHLIPIEELLFLWLMPFFLVTIYELYVDDGQ